MNLKCMQLALNTGMDDTFKCNDIFIEGGKACVVQLTEGKSTQTSLHEFYKCVIHYFPLRSNTNYFTYSTLYYHIEQNI